MTVSIVSVDIGMKNMSIAIITVEDMKITGIDFTLYDLEKYGITKKSAGVVVQRCTASREISELVFSSNIVDYFVIEKQVPENENAMCLMYCMYMMATNHIKPENVSLFDPKMKFTSLGLSYNTKNKKHKMLSIELARMLLTNLGYANKLKEFENNKKKDDIADSINQGIVWLYKEKYLTSSTIRQLYKLEQFY